MWKTIMKYKDLEVWKKAKELVSEIHRMTLEDLPKFEMYETGSQIRRSMNSVRANIVEGYGRRCYKNDFLHFLIYAESSTDETIDHLESLYETGSLKSKEKYENLHERLVILGKMLNNLIKKVREEHRT
jgi:four helix bundle protein